jgi:TRAP-type C4-dicarboxylate transport system substrate-binding protein
VGIHNNKRPIKNSEDFKGLKMRWSGPMGAATLKALGAISIVSVPEEMYSAFQQGMIDGGANPAVVFYARKLYDVQKYITDAGMLNASGLSVVWPVRSYPVALLQLTNCQPVPGLGVMLTLSP